MVDDDVTRPVASEAPTLRVLSVALLVVDGPSRGARVALPEGVARVGTARGNELRLADPTVARVHCELRVRSGTILVRDCGSTNGTFVEGVRLREGEVRPGALVRVGSSAFRIEESAGATYLPLSDRTSFGECVGSSIEMRRVYATLERAAPTASTVLIEGETGTGKDVAARSLHANSPRASGPFVPIDCGAIPLTLIESELFGHVRGAFSGAVADRRGVFEEAAGGTVFLDEIGELPMQVQPKLLRAIEQRAIRRVGSNTERAVDVRIIAATNRSLAACVNEGTFREDLYYRLAVIELRVPPLRARRDDIAVLAARSWPGNVRELRNFIERSVSLGLVEQGPPSSSKLPPEEDVAADTLERLVELEVPLKDARQAWTERFETVYVRGMLRKTRGNLTRAAELAGVNRRFMQRIVSRLASRGADLGVDPGDLEDED